MNQVSLVGRIVRDPEIHVTKSGHNFTYITLAVTRNYRNSVTGLYDTDFIPCKLWGKVAMNVVNHCEKGSLIGVTGRIENRLNNDPAIPNQPLEVVANRVSFLARPNRHQDQQEDDTLFIDADREMNDGEEKEDEEEEE